MKLRIVILLLASLSLAVIKADGQRAVTIKTDFVHTALPVTPNLALEVALSSKISAEITGAYNPFVFGEKKIKHYMVRPSIRYYFDEVAQGGHFVAMDLFGGQFNAVGWNIPIKPLSYIKDFRYEGTFYGVGLGYGYRYDFAKHWGIEFGLSLGYARIDYEKFKCIKCGSKIGEGKHNHIGVTKAAIALVYKI
ncbi:DUF3575 domain-containing protein [Porphyromonas sp.]|uniref:DUF3575 domain-containing protein n=1 Tax=Porphyromonas sp. TaxID=1924944 RepID=UPI0026DB3E81|nr:DUF3575 domain-containing protein [Porphyromonas sp.]MDO4695659.1 DUF3575 domain-containing protein [Porphyromonas sp.]MDO4770320.1 DUF3575 domain-containing protein [Porphyromonas sp.]